MNSLLIILLSTILFNVSFFWIDYCGWLILFFPIPIFLICNDLEIKFLKAWSLGFLWGAMSFGGHFIWFLILLLTKSNATIPVAILLYLLAVIYLSVTSGFWIFLSNFIIKRLSKKGRIGLSICTFGVIGWLYFIFLQSYSFRFFGKGAEYPFISPLIPLARYNIFRIFCFIFTIPPLLVGGYCTKALGEEGSFADSAKIALATSFRSATAGQATAYEVIYLKPDARPSYLGLPAVVTQRIYQKLGALNLGERAEGKDFVIIAAPESTFPFALNKHPEAVRMWSNMLPEKAYFLIGGFREVEEKLFQSIYLISKGRINFVYDKSQPVPFSEKIPRLWRNYSFSRWLFLKNKKAIKTGASPQYFNINEKVSILPLVCADFFFTKKGGWFVAPENLDKEKVNLIFGLINDSWFPSYFRKIMLNYAYLKVAQYGLPTFYVTHSKIEFINPLFCARF